MIAIVSSTPRERAALTNLCGVRGWPAIECGSISRFVRLIHRVAPKVVVVRHKLENGFSDDAFAALARLNLLPATRVIVLLAAGASSAVEMRQIALGADWAPRDPIRADVLLAYVDKYYRSLPGTGTRTTSSSLRSVSFCGATLLSTDRTLARGKARVTLTPREVSLVELLAHSSGEVITYDELYAEVLTRRFGGDTSNMRVLLQKLSRSVQRLEIDLSQWLTVIPKTGYRYKQAAAVGPY